MSPNEIVECLKDIGANLTRRTLLNYEKWGLVPEPERGGGGPGGKYTSYPDGTLPEAYAAWVLLNGKYGDPKYGKMPPFSPELVRQARLWGRDEDSSQLLLGYAEEAHKKLLASTVSPEGKAKRLESKINRLVITNVMSIWKLERDRAKILLGMPE